MHKPQKKIIPESYKRGEWADILRNKGYNEACEDWESWLVKKEKKKKNED